MTGRANQPRDLVWNLEDFRSPDNAMRFFNLFKNSFMVYSSSVEKLYCAYSSQLTGPMDRKRLVVLPDFNQFESIFSRINATAVSKTSIVIYPKVIQGKPQLLLSGHAKAADVIEILPLKQGLRALKMGYFDQNPVFPALMLGDLREFPEKPLPYLRLHSVNCAQLSSLSDFDRRDVSKGAWAKLGNFM